LELQHFCVICAYLCIHKYELFVFVAERISARLSVRDLFSQWTYVRVCHAQECQFALMCT